ncbi:MAG: hypothetical protein C4K58_07775 [Flavobacteriaceae bacterium]|nr:MAG: hypothetical protein C4K58_07775 [Flavobacteriaceae bacterium]
MLQKFTLSFPIILIPFVLVNGILTGAISPEPVVWYSPKEIIGIRCITIPIEDFAYCFSLLFLNLWVFERLRKTKKKNI